MGLLLNPCAGLLAPRVKAIEWSGCETRAGNLRRLASTRGCAQFHSIPTCVRLAMYCMQADFRRLAGTRGRDHVTLPANVHAAAWLPMKLCGYLNNRLHPLLLDTCLNGTARVATNLFEAAAFTAFKLVCCQRSLRETPRWQIVAAAVATAVEYCATCTPRVVTQSASVRAAGGLVALPRCATLPLLCPHSRV